MCPLPHPNMHTTLTDTQGEWWSTMSQSTDTNEKRYKATRGGGGFESVRWVVH